MKTVTIKHKEVSIRSHPYTTEFSEDTVGTLKYGDRIEINEQETCFDWLGNKFYRCSSPIGEGWIIATITSI